ncbi:MAG: hypothetical protein K8R77_06060 [Anaerolineaceae bacterium]|nr:hypothetical protein [Anaerolineaceae bacterium]
MSKNSNGFNNFAVLTAEVSDIEVKEARNGKKYKVGKATLLGLTYTGEDGQEYYPVIDVLVFNGAKKHLKPGKVKLVGNLSYAEWEDGNGNKHSQLKVIANYVEAASEDERAKAFCKLTLRVGKDGESRLSSKTGNPWASVRASLSMGKDEDGQYRPSLWLTLKAFTHNGNEDFVYSVADLAQGEYIDVSGGLSCDEYKGRLNWGLFLNNNGFVYHDFDSAGDADGAEEEAIEEAEELEELEAIPD